MAISVKNAEAIERMRISCRIVAEVLEEMKNLVRPGVTTAELDRVAEEIIRSYGAVPSFKGYQGYPASICASVDDQVIQAEAARASISISFFNVFIMSSVLLVWKVKS